MEALALLCTLHADGPATLRRLRRAGCDTLEALEAYEPEALADLLSLTPAAARRFEREARMLCTRLATDLLEREEEAPASARAVALANGHSYAGDTGSLERKDRDILGKVLERWRREEAPAGGTAEGERVRELEPFAREREPEPEDEPEPEAPVASGIEPDLLDGLDAHRCADLARGGIGDLDALIEAAPLELATALGEGIAQVRRWQFLARRIAGERDEEPTERVEEPTERAGVSTSSPPPPRAAPPLTARKPWPVQALPGRHGDSRPSAPEPAAETAPPETGAPETVPAETVIPRRAAPSEPLRQPAPGRSWVPRKFWEAPRSAPAGEAEAEPEARVAPSGEAPSRSATKTILNWNFEIPPPPPPLPTRPSEVEQAGGPFA